MGKKLTTKQKLEAIEAFNYLFKIGDEITVKYNGKDVKTTTVSRSIMLEGHTPVVWVSGIPSCISLASVIIKMKKRKSDLLGITYYVPDCGGN
jgi:hypothetical protein